MFFKKKLYNASDNYKEQIIHFLCNGWFVFYLLKLFLMQKN